MANSSENHCSGSLSVGSQLSQPWRSPGLEYPFTPGLLSDFAEVCNIVPLKLSATSDKVTDEALAEYEYELYKLQQPYGPRVSVEKRELALGIAKRFHDKVKSNFLGFQANMAASYSHLSHYLDTHVNNLGDPFTVGSFLSQTKFMERAVLDYFAALWNADWPHDTWTKKTDPDNPSNPALPEKPSSYWGFVLTMGCTEGNLYAMWNGRDYLAGKVMLMDGTDGGKESRGNKKKPKPRYVIADCETIDENSQKCRKRSLTPVCFFSQDTHYSLKKAMVILNIKTFNELADEMDFPAPPAFNGVWPTDVPSNENGSVNVDALAILIEEFAKRGYPALICLNYGTTFKGAYDDVQEAATKLLPIFRRHGLLNRTFCYKDENQVEQCITRNGFWFHVDGALGAAYMPFLKIAEDIKMFQPEVPIHPFDFSLRAQNTGEEFDYSDVEVVHSIAISGHKWIGVPVPTGVYMTKSKYQLMPPVRPNYIGTPDTTFAGSRSGLSSLFLWDYLSRHSFHDLIEKAIYTQNVASRFAEKLRVLEEEIKAGKYHPNVDSLWITHTPLSLAVIFRRPNKAIVQKYSLSEEEEIDKETGEQHLLVHAFAMEHVTYDRIDSLIADLCTEGAFDLGETPSDTLQHRFKIEW